MASRPGVRVAAGVLALTAMFGIAHADDKVAAAKQKEAATLMADGDYVGALAAIDAGLAAAPGQLALLQLRASTLVELRDYEGALAAYEAFLDAGAKGANKRTAVKIVASLKAVRTTKLALTVPGASPESPASVYVDTKTLGAFCTAAPTCTRGILPGSYKLIVERAGYQKISERVKVVRDQTLTLERALVEEPSAASIAVIGPSNATISIDGEVLGPAPQAWTLPPGDHLLEVRADGYLTWQQTLTAHEGAPIELSIAMRPLVPVTVNVPGAEVLLDDEEAPRQDGALVLPEDAVTLTVRAPGYTTQTIDVPAARPAGYRLDVTLVLAPAPFAMRGAPANARVSVDGAAAGPVPGELAQGEHTIVVTAPDRHTLRTTVRVDSAAPVELEVTRMPSTKRTWLWVAAIGTGAAIVSSGAFGALALGKQSDYDARARQIGVTPEDLASLESSGDRFATIADISVGVAVVGAVAAVWLYLTEGKGSAAGEIHF